MTERHQQRDLDAAAAAMRLAPGQDPSDLLTDAGTPRPGACLYRTLTIGGAATRAIDEEARTVELAVSSEDPYRRWFGVEVLDHSAASVRMERMNNGAALLNQHDTHQQIGVVERASLDADRRLRATVRFGRGPLAEEVFRDVVDGIRRHVSVGYRVHADQRESTDENGVDTWRVTDWEPLEVSIVSVPADATVGVGRAVHHSPQPRHNPQQETTAMPDDNRTDVLDDEPNTQARGAEGNGSDGATDHHGSDDVGALTGAAREAEDAAIRKLAKQFDCKDLGEEWVELGGTADDLRADIIKRRRAAKPQPVPAAREPRIEVSAKRFKPLRGFATEEAAFKAGQWVMASIYGNQKAQRWCADHYVRAASTSSLSGGGAVVPEEMSQAVIDLRNQYGVARQLCRVIPMASDTLTVPRRVSGVTAYAVGQNQEITDSDKDWNQVQLTARKWAALSKLPMEYVEDAFIDVAGDLADEMAYAFAVKEDEAYINGDGTSTYHGIYGLRPKIIDGNHAAGAVHAASNVDTLAEITNTDLTNALGKIPTYARGNTRILCSPLARDVTFGRLSAASGGTTMTELSGMPRPSYLGRPIFESEAMPNVSSDLSNVAMLLMGDFAKASTMGDRRGFTVQILTERYAEYDQIGIKATTRFDIVNHDLGDNTNAGPVVALVGE